MKILMLHPHDVQVFPWMIRPIKIAEELINRGHSVTLAYIRNDQRKAKLGVIHKNLPKQLTAIPLGSARRELFENLELVKKLAHDVDVIHLQKCSSNSAYLALVTASQMNKPLHYDWDDWETEIAIEMGLKYLELLNIRWYEERLPKSADTISVSSQALHEKVLKIGLPENRIFPAPVGADLTFFNPLINGNSIKAKHGITGPVVIYSGQLDGANYVNLLIQGIPLINQKISNVTFIIVGGGKTLAQHKELAEELQIKNIIFTGYLPHDEIPQYLAAADVAVACFEDTPITRCKSPLKIAEYLAGGKAIVASRVGEVIPMVEDCGLLTAPGDWQDLAQQIILLLSNPVLRQELSVKARKRAEEKYNWKNTTDQIESAYRLAISNPRKDRETHPLNLWGYGLVTGLFYGTRFVTKTLGIWREKEEEIVVK